MAKFRRAESGLAAVALVVAMGAQATVVRELYDPDAGGSAAAQLALDFVASPARSAVSPLPGAAEPSFASHASADPVAPVMADADALRAQPTPGADAAGALPSGQSVSYGLMALAVAAAAMLAGVFGAAGVAGVARWRRR